MTTVRDADPANREVLGSVVEPVGRQPTGDDEE
jgi:hypothetical protein